MQPVLGYGRYFVSAGVGVFTWLVPKTFGTSAGNNWQHVQVVRRKWVSQTHMLRGAVAWLCVVSFNSTAKQLKKPAMNLNYYPQSSRKQRTATTTTIDGSFICYGNGNSAIVAQQSGHFATTWQLLWRSSWETTIASVVVAYVCIHYVALTSPVRQVCNCCCLFYWQNICRQTKKFLHSLRSSAVVWPAHLPAP